MILLSINPWPFKGEYFQDSYLYGCCHRVLDYFHEFPSISMYFNSVCSIYEEVTVMVDSDTSPSCEVKMKQISIIRGPCLFGFLTKMK
jgi:hypothetical protein